MNFSLKMSYIQNKLFYIAFLFISFNLDSKEINLKITKNNLNKIYKIYQLKNFESILDEKYIFSGEKNLFYSNCGNDFPVLPGNFPCSFLSDEFLDDEISISNTSGGQVSVRQSSIKSKLGGYVYEVSSGEDEEFKLILYYGKHSYINLYKYIDNIIVFNWSKGKNKALLDIYILKIYSKEITSIKRIKFDDK